MKANPNPSQNRIFSSHHLSGKVGWILLWLIGVPVPLLLIFFLLRGCT
jgi:hypothetical protein